MQVNEDEQVEQVEFCEHPRDADPSVSEHLSRCSPCFNDYMEILGELKRDRTILL